LRNILRTAVRSLGRNIGRSALTCLGIIIGIAAVIAMVEVGQGASSAVQRTIAGMGANLIGVTPDSSSSGGVSAGAGTGMTLSPQDAEAIARECPSVRWAAPSVDARAQLVYGNRNWGVQSIKGSTPDYLQVRNWLPLAEGESFTDDDVRRGAMVCLIGQTVARQLFPDGQSPLGRQIRMKNVDVRVIGVLSAKGANMMGRDQDDIVVAPWTTIKYRLSGDKAAFQDAAVSGSSSAAAAQTINSLQNLYPSRGVALYPQQSAAQNANAPRVFRFNDLDDIYVSAESPESIAPAIREISTVLRDRHRLKASAPDDFSVRSPTEIARTLEATTRSITNLLLSVALISLAVGGVGIMNIMLVSVTERTREIGLRMAVGARARDILTQFLIEALLLCLIGGIAGIILGHAASTLVTRLLEWPTVVSPEAILAALGVCVAVGLIFGYYPAWKAARLDPIEALRHE
jgi:ABC-type antimicrobial peptide transport system permease subunit